MDEKERQLIGLPFEESLQQYDEEQERKGNKISTLN